MVALLSFPANLLDALRPRRAWRVLQLLPRDPLRTGRLVVVRGALPREVAARWGAALERAILPLTRLDTIPIPRSTITRMRHNYSEELPKTVSVRSAPLLGRPTRAMKAARSLGLYDMLRSPGVRAIVEEALGRRVGKRCGAQVFRYGPFDYQGPHNDFQPEDPTIADGYVDLQISLPSRGIASQALIFEKNGLLREVVDVAKEPLVLVYELPFWHQVTPLVPARRCSPNRWLLIGSFERRP